MQQPVLVHGAPFFGLDTLVLPETWERTEHLRAGSYTAITVPFEQSIVIAEPELFTVIAVRFNGNASQAQPSNNRSLCPVSALEDA